MHDRQNTFPGMSTLETCVPCRQQSKVHPPDTFLVTSRHPSIHLLARKSRMKNLTHCLSEPHVQRIAFEARMPDHGVQNRQYHFRRFQTDQIMKLCHRPCDESRHR